MRLWLVCLLVIFFNSLSAQTYWQQHVATKINVLLDDKQHFLHGFEELTYTNNSNDTLKYLYIHLWPNAYKHEYTPFAKQLEQNGNTSFYHATKAQRGYIDSLDFKVDGKEVEVNSSLATPDIALLTLQQPLLPHAQLKLTTPFRVKIPEVFSRMGHTGQAYYISQWFPKPAVYDAKGWHPMSYLDQGEFFSEFGSYEVDITLPKNYVLLATGNLTTSSETAWLDSMAHVPDSMFQNEAYFPLSSSAYKTVHFSENNVHDFAWFADKRYIVRKDTMANGNKEPLQIYTAFLPTYLDNWSKAINHIKGTIAGYGKLVEQYPYQSVKVVSGDLNAGGGMEYPTITVIDNSSSNMLKRVIVHEVGHNWFYGMLASNERDFPWMDEGLNTFYEQKVIASMPIDSPVSKSLFEVKEDLWYYELASIHADQPIKQSATQFGNINYGTDIYHKSNLFLQWLEQYMGPKDFEKAMHAYFTNWQLKHPYPDDFKQSMQANTTKDINWWFQDLLATVEPIDYKIKKIRTIGDSVAVTVVNKGQGIRSIQLKQYFKNGNVTQAWTPLFEHQTTVMLAGNNWDKIVIDSIIPDVQSGNNIYTRYGLFHKFKIQLKPIFGIKKPYHYPLYMTPILGYNQYNGFMFGLGIHNMSIPESKFRMLLAPMYAVGNNSITGGGSIGYALYPKATFKEIMLQVDGKSYAFNTINGTSLKYNRLSPSVSFLIDNRVPHSPIDRTLTLRGYFINEQKLNTAVVSNPEYSGIQQYYSLNYLHQNARTHNPFSYVANVQGSANFIKSELLATFKVDYNKPNKWLNVTGYIGKYISIGKDVDKRYWLNPIHTGYNDYTYDHTYVGRNETNGMFAQQVHTALGGFHFPQAMALYPSNNWLGTMALESTLPGIKNLVTAYMNVGLTPNLNPTYTNRRNNTMFYESGLKVTLMQQFVQVYIPIFLSNDFQNYLSNNYEKKDRLAKSISFVFDINKVNALTATTSYLRTKTH